MNNIDISFDSSAAQMLIDWAHSGSAVPPDAWRSLPAYQLTRMLAKCNNLPNPDTKVRKRLNEIVRVKRRGSTEKILVCQQNLMDVILRRQKSFRFRIVSHLQVYLPPGTKVTGRVLFTLFIPFYAFAWIGNTHGSVVINLDSPFWEWNAGKVLNLLVHEFYHLGFARYQQGTAVNDCRTGKDLTANILWQIQNEGMATYVAYRARSRGLAIPDYRLLNNAAEVRARFDSVRALLRDAGRAEAAAIHRIRKRIWTEGVDYRAFYIAGAHMARRIEQRLGRKALVETVKKGARAFAAAYVATQPPSHLRLDA